MKHNKFGLANTVCLVVLLSWSALARAATGDFAQCPQFFFDGRPPQANLAPDMRPRALCFDGFAVLHSGKTHTPLFVAERLNRAGLEKRVERSDHFYEEARLPAAEKSRLTDYRDSGYDRGHMAPAADMDTPEAMAQSFSLANIVPQAPTNNRRLWAKIEKDTRKYVMRARGDVFVITGPVFATPSATIGNDKVWVPKYLFKLVYDPATGKAWAHWIENRNDAVISRPISYEELTARTGMRLLAR
jgi:endonuclease G, mitochondrial